MKEKVEPMEEEQKPNTMDGLVQLVFELTSKLPATLYALEVKKEGMKGEKIRIIEYSDRSRDFENWYTANEMNWMLPAGWYLLTQGAIQSLAHISNNRVYWHNMDNLVQKVDVSWSHLTLTNKDNADKEEKVEKEEKVGLEKEPVTLKDVASGLTLEQSKSKKRGKTKRH